MARTKKNLRNTLTYETLPALFTGICDAIRTQTGASGQINHQDIPAEILAIQTGGDTIVAINESVSVAAYGSGSKSYTAEAAGTLNIIAVANGVGENQISLTKNGSGVSEYISFKNNTGTATVRSAYNLAVAANDVIAVNLTTASVAATCLILAILTPTT